MLKKCKNYTKELKYAILIAERVSKKYLERECDGE